jgi:hypothetical protein
MRERAVRTAAVAGVLTVLLAACGGFGLRSGESAQPLPAPTTEPRHEMLDDDENQVRIWPRSARVEEGVAYHFTAYTHCGLDHALDFDGSFWRLDARLTPDSHDLGDPDDTGTIRLESTDVAVFTSARGTQYRLVRHDGPLDTFFCD